ncbi:MAG: CBS domain-containing protein [Bryobacterales bacterium]
MRSGSAAVMPGSMRVAEAFEAAHQERGALSGVGLRQGAGSGRRRTISRKRSRAAIRTKTVYRALPLRTVVRLYPDLSLDSALRLLGNYPILPVVSRANSNQLLGVITLRDVHAAYGIASAVKDAESG